MENLNDQRRDTIVVLGLGNTLLQDEGLGVEALMRLQSEYQMPAHVTLLDGGVLGLDLLPYMESADAVLILDAVQTRDPPGTLIRLDKEEIPAVIALKMSVHQVGLQETLAMSRFRGTLPDRLTLLGVVPVSLGLGVQLTSTVVARLDDLVDAAVAELQRWGVELMRAEGGKSSLEDQAG
ncbi:MAG: HyaD/HybD family hydrogenase maturation endopeptidase [Anaerolineae bacterium]